MLNSMTNSIAHFFYDKKVIEDEGNIEVYAYGLELLMASLVNVVGVLIISLFFKQFMGAGAFLSAFISIRTFAGGYHAKTHLNCFIILIFVYSINLALVYMVPGDIMIKLILISIIFSLVIIYLLAPIDDANKPLSKEEKQKCRKISLSIIAIQVMIVVFLLSLHISSDTLFSFTNGQLAASVSLLVAKIINKRKDEENEKGYVNSN